MKAKPLPAIVFRVICVLLLHGAAIGAATSQGLPLGSEVMTKVLERAAQVAKSGEAGKYEYEKCSLHEELNARGEATSSAEKIYKVVQINGWPFSRLVKVQGKDLSPAEIQREDRKEQEFRNRIAGRDLRKSAEEKEPWIPPELVARYEFTVLGNEVRQSRNTLVLEFKVKPGSSESSIQDRVLNRLSGRLWVDESDAEIARVEVRLTEELSLGWLGVLGSLKQCDLDMDRQRMPDGTWVHTKHILLLVGRKVISSMRFRATEESRNFVRHSG